MADKKVERSRRERPLTPKQKMEAALSDPGTMNVADTAHDKGKSSLVDKFREREERWRRDQALHDQQAAHATEAAYSTERGGREGEGPDETADPTPPQGDGTQRADRDQADRGRDGRGGTDRRKGSGS